MKKKFLTLIAVAGLFITASAQKIQRYDAFAPTTLEEIKATPEQKQRLSDLMKEHREKVIAIRKNTALSEEEKRAEIAKANRQRNAFYFNEILTPEQTKYIKDKQEEVKKGGVK